MSPPILLFVERRMMSIFWAHSGPQHHCYMACLLVSVCKYKPCHIVNTQIIEEQRPHKVYMPNSSKRLIGCKQVNPSPLRMALIPQHQIMDF